VTLNGGVAHEPLAAPPFFGGTPSWPLLRQALVSPKDLAASRLIIGYLFIHGKVVVRNAVVRQHVARHDNVKFLRFSPKDMLLCCVHQVASEGSFRISPGREFFPAIFALHVIRRSCLAREMAQYMLNPVVNFVVDEAYTAFSFIRKFASQRP
jgi:hypothetical protein